MSLKPDCGPAPSTASVVTAQSSSAASIAYGLCPACPGKCRQRPVRHVRCRWCEWTGKDRGLHPIRPGFLGKADARIPGAGFYLSAHPLDAYRQLLDKLRVQNFADFSVAVKTGCVSRASGRHRHLARSARRAPATRWASSPSRMPPGSMRPCSSRKASTNTGPSRGRQIAGADGAGRRAPEGIGLRIQTAQSLEEQSIRMQKAMRVYVREFRPLACRGRSPECQGRRPRVLHRHQGRGTARDRGGADGAFRISPEIAAPCAPPRVCSTWSSCKTVTPSTSRAVTVMKSVPSPVSGRCGVRDRDR